MKILIVKTSSLGDAIHIFPVIDYLRQVYPTCQIDWIVEESLKDLVLSHPQVNGVISIDTRGIRKQFWKRAHWKHLWAAFSQMRQVRYDLLLDLQGNIKSSLVTAAAKAEQKVGFGKRTVSEWPNLLVTRYRYDPPQGLNAREEYLYVVKQHVGGQARIPDQAVVLRTEVGDREIVRHLVGRKGMQVAVCPGSAWKNKRLSDAALLEFLDHVHARLKCQFLWVWGSSEEKSLAELLWTRFPESSVIVPKLSLPALQYLMWKVDLVVAMDSLALHLAGTTPTPTFSAFGPTSPGKFKPQGKHHHIRGECPYGESFSRRCRKLRSCSTGACIRELTGTGCFDSFIRWWKESHSNAEIHPPPKTRSPS